MNEKPYGVAYIVTPPTENNIESKEFEAAKAEAWDKLCSNPLKDHFNRKDVFDIAFKYGYQISNTQLENGLANHRLQVAAMAMQGLLAGGMKKGIIKRTIELTDALLTKLSKENNDTDSNK